MIIHDADAAAAIGFSIRLRVTENRLKHFLGFLQRARLMSTLIRFSCETKLSKSTSSQDKSQVLDKQKIKK